MATSSDLQPPLLPEHPIRMALADTLQRSRLIVFFRVLLAIPHLIWLYLWGYAAEAAALIAWLVALITGRVPEPLHRFIAAYVRYQTHVYSFVFLIGGPFPGFVGRAGSYPVDVEIDPPAPQRRLVTLFRLVLVIPAGLLALVLSLVVLVVGILGWWASLVLGRMPQGMRDLGAVSLRYLTQTNAYLYMLTDRYPNSSPLLPVPAGPSHPMLPDARPALATEDAPPDGIAADGG